MTRRTAKPTRRTPGTWGTCEQLPSGRWRAFYRREGRKFTAPRTFPSKADAAAWLAAEHADRARGTWRDPDAGRVLLADYAWSWLDARPDLAPRTRDLYARTLGRWVLPRVGESGSSRGVALGQMDVADLTPAVVRTWYAALFSATRAAASEKFARNAPTEAQSVRAWARASGIAVASTGRISPAIVAAWRDAGSPPAPATHAERRGEESPGATAAAHAYRVLRAILTTAVSDGLLAANPCQIKRAGSVTHRERGTATPEEVARLAAAMPAQWAAAVTLAAWSGLRYGELFALTRRDVDADAGTIRVQRALVAVPGEPVQFGKTKTDKSRRTVHVPEFVADSLRAHLAAHVGSGRDALLFTLQDGSPVPNGRLSIAFRAAREAIGRDDLTWHDLRHTGATLAYQAGASLPEVQARLGHTTMRAAQVYAHAATGSDKVLADRLHALFSSTHLAHEGAPA
jgi:integrase